MNSIATIARETLDFPVRVYTDDYGMTAVTLRAPELTMEEFQAGEFYPATRNNWPTDRDEPRRIEEYMDSRMTRPIADFDSVADAREMLGDAAGRHGYVVFLGHLFRRCG